MGGCGIQLGKSSSGLNRDVAVEIMRIGQIKGAFGRERQLIDFKREELNSNSLKHKRNSKGVYWLL